MATMDPTASPDATPAPASAAGDLSQGYCIEISVLPDGTFNVSGPEPLAEEAEEEQGGESGEGGEDESAEDESGTTVDSIGAALKAVLQIIKENPVSGDEDAQFQAGYGADK